MNTTHTQTPGQLNLPGGRSFHPFMPEPGIFTLDDIARRLPKARFQGDSPVTVAQHSEQVRVRALEILPSLSLAGQIYAHMHDSGEAPSGCDHPGPSKADMLVRVHERVGVFHRLVGDIEDEWTAIFLDEFFGITLADIPPAEQAAVKQADKEVAQVERAAYLSEEGPIQSLPGILPAAEASAAWLMLAKQFQVSRWK